MKCCVVKNAEGEVVAAYPHDLGDISFKMELEKGETTVEMDIPEEAMCDPDTFLRSCSSQ